MITIGHLLFAATATGYILASIAFEEHDLKLSLGPAYASYQARVPALIPRGRTGRSGAPTTNGRKPHEQQGNDQAPGGAADTGGRAAASALVGMFPPFGLLEQGPETARAVLAQMDAAGIDHVCCGDHVSFFTGLGFDGLVQATALAMLHPTLPVYSGLYLLPLRHPVLVARQLADIDRLAPGRLISASEWVVKTATKRRSAGWTQRPGACG